MLDLDVNQLKYITLLDHDLMGMIAFAVAALCEQGVNTNCMFNHHHKKSFSFLYCYHDIWRPLKFDYLEQTDSQLVCFLNYWQLILIKLTIKDNNTTLACLNRVLLSFNKPLFQLPCIWFCHWNNYANESESRKLKSISKFQEHTFT